MGKLLNFEYGTIHGFYWMIYGSLVSFASAYLLANDYSNSQIGLVIAIANVLAVVIQPFTADLADRSRRFTAASISQIISAAMLVLTAAVFLLRGQTVALFVLYVLLIALHTVLQPLLNYLCFKLEECGVHMNFGMCRCGGSLAYAALCAVLGTAVEKFGAGILPLVDGSITLLLMGSIALTMFHFRRILSANKSNLAGSTLADKPEEETIGLGEFIKRNKVFVIMNLGIFLIFIHNQLLNNFMLQIVQSVGGDSGDMGRILSVMAFLEIPTMFCFDWINRKFSCAVLLKVAAVGFSLKIAAVFLASSVTLVFAAQFLQLISFALFLPAIVKFIDEIMSRGEAVKGQALYTMMQTTSSIMSSLVGGFILDSMGARTLTGFGTVTCLLGTVIIFLTVDRCRKA